MRLLQRYILGELLRVFVFVLSVLTVLLGFLGVFQQITERGLGPLQVLQVMPYLIPSLVPYTIPATLLLSVCVVYGRMAGDQEITAAKAAGISVMSLLAPSLFFGAVMSIASLLLTDQVIPWAESKIERIVASGMKDIVLDLLRNQNQITIDVLDNDSDPNGDTITRQDFTQPATEAGTVEETNDGQLRFTPALGFSGEAEFTYTIGDGRGGSDAATVTITVAPNAAPIALADTFVTRRNTATTLPAACGVLANDADANLDPLTAALVDAPDNGQLTLNSDGSFVYSPNNNFAGTDTFTYQANDGLLDSDPMTVTIQVLDDNAVGVIVNGELRVHAGNTNDTVTIRPVGTNLQVTLNGRSSLFARADVQSLRVNASGDNDRVTVDPLVLVPTVLDGGDGNDTLTAGGGNATLLGGTGNDTLRRGTDYRAADGDDRLFFSQGDLLNGGAGNDSAFADEATAAVTLDLTNSNLELVQGSRFNDTLDASTVTTSIKLLGRDGNDTLRGGTGTDVLSGGAGNDDLTAGPRTTDGAIDHLSGDIGTDTIRRHLLDLDLVFSGEVILNL